MKIIDNKNPYQHLELIEFFTDKENDILYDLCVNALDKEEYNTRNLFIVKGAYEDEYDTSVGMLGLDIPEEITNNIKSNLEEISKFYNIRGNWQFCFNVSDPEGFLSPHTDDYHVNKLSNPEAGVIKVLIYIGKQNIDYSEYGTKLYNDQYNFKKEIIFKPGNGLAFTPNKDSYHGTDFKGKLNNYRFILGAELTYA